VEEEDREKKKEGRKKIYEYLGHNVKEAPHNFIRQ
jgi:hypothetical protein